jgi:tetrahydromethanopterin S-methyltransferase subunit G
MILEYRWTTITSFNGSSSFLIVSTNYLAMAAVIMKKCLKSIPYPTVTSWRWKATQEQIFLHETIKSGKIKFRQYIRNAAETGILDDKLFAVDLSKIESLSSKEAREFFDRTEIVKDTSELIGSILGRLTGGDATAAYLLDTKMGGGKSHTLAYIYLLFKHSKTLKPREDVKEFLRKADLNDLPTPRLIVLDGVNMDSSLSFVEHPTVKQFFDSGDAKEKITHKIDELDEPVVFLIDEILQYLGRRQNPLRDLEHIRSLVEAVVDSENSLIIISIPEDDPNKEGYKQISDMFKALGRKSKLVRPQAAGEDFVAIAKKQIFEYVDAEVAEKAAEWAKQTYISQGIEFGKELEDKFRQYYPFHPMLIELVTTRLPEFLEFRRTRDALKILAGVCIDMLANNSKFSTPYLTVGDVMLGGMLKATLSSYTIFSIKNIDNIVAEILRTSLSTEERRVATAIYLYSLHPSAEKRGLSGYELFEALLTGSVGDLQRLADDYIHNQSMYMEKNEENGKFYFRETPSAIFLIRKEAQRIQDITKQLQTTVAELSNEFGRECNVAYDGEPVEDKLNIMFAPLIYAADKKAKVEEYSEDRHLFERSGPFNSVVIVYPSEVGETASLEQSFKELIAAQNLKKQYKDNKDYLRAIENEIKRLESEALNNFVRCYTGLLFLQKGKRVHETLNLSEISKEAYVRSLKNALRSKQKAYLDISELNLRSYFNELLGNADEASVSELYSNVKASSVVPFLPRNLFDEAVRRAVAEGIIGLVSDDQIVTLPSTISDSYKIVSADRLSEIEKKRSPIVISQPKQPIVTEEWQEQPKLPEKPNVPVRKFWTETTTGKENEINDMKGFLTQLSLLSSKSNNPVKITIKIWNQSGSITLTTNSNKISQLKSMLDHFAKTFENTNYSLKTETELDENYAQEFESRLRAANLQWRME